MGSIPTYLPSVIPPLELSYTISYGFSQLSQNYSARGSLQVCQDVLETPLNWHGLLLVVDHEH